MVEIGGIWRAGIIVDPGSFASKVRFGSGSNTREHHHDNRESLGLPIFQNGFRVGQRIATKQFPLRVREKIKRLSTAIDKIPSVFADAKRPFRSTERD